MILIVGILKWRHSSCSGRQSFDSNASSTESSLSFSSTPVCAPLQCFWFCLHIASTGGAPAIEILYVLWWKYLVQSVKGFAFLRSLLSSASACDSFFFPLLRFGICKWWWLCIFSNYDVMEKAKTSRDAAGSPLAAESCSSNWIGIGRFESFGCFCVDDDMSCLSQAMLVRVNHFTHLTILQICLNTLLLSLSFKKQSIQICFSAFIVLLPSLACVLYLAEKGWTKRQASC